jgi:hypothetical protein
LGRRAWFDERMASDPTLSSSSLDQGEDAVSLTEDLVNI